MKQFFLFVALFITSHCFSQQRMEGIQTITTGTATTIANDVVCVFVNPSALMATHSITMPAAPSDRQEITVWFGGTLTSGTVVTVLSIVANTGQSLLQISAPTTAVAGDCVIYVYYRSSNVWYRKK